MAATTSTPQKTHSTLRRIFFRWAAKLATTLLLLAASGAVWLYWRSHACLPQLDGTLRLAGLRSPVQVLRDAHGAPHVRAQSLEDLLFAQGYVTAQDRLWQMDMSRRLAKGELSEILGEAVLRLDVESRTLGLRQLAERAVGELDPEARRLLGAYAGGVNAFISSHRSRLPIEFLILRYEPQPWQEADSLCVAITMTKALNTSWSDELMRERNEKKLSPELYEDLFPDHSPWDEPVAEPVPNPRALAPVAAASKTTVAPETLLGAWAASQAEASSGSGSNNWVVSGAHTRSGKPLLANDPHLGHSVPSVWTMVHLKAPGLDASGVTFPGLPFVVLGHNERIAWGATNTGPDVQDLYVETFNLRDPRKYLHKGQWVGAEQREEIIKVRGKRDYPFLVKVTRHGPVVSHDGDRDLALRWTALEPHALRFPFLKIDRAQNWQEFTAALRDFTGPMQNFVYADVDGNIGTYAAGWLPVRKHGEGTVPSPGDADDYDWSGYVPFEDLPHAFNPPAGMISTANGPVVPQGDPLPITPHKEAALPTPTTFQATAGR